MIGTLQQSGHLVGSVIPTPRTPVNFIPSAALDQLRSLNGVGSDSCSPTNVVFHQIRPSISLPSLDTVRAC